MKLGEIYIYGFKLLIGYNMTSIDNRKLILGIRQSDPFISFLAIRIIKNNVTKTEIFERCLKNQNYYFLADNISFDNINEITIELIH